MFGALQDVLPITCRPSKALAAHYSPGRPISSELCLFLTLPLHHIAARRAMMTYRLGCFVLVESNAIFRNPPPFNPIVWRYDSST